MSSIILVLLSLEKHRNRSMDLFPKSVLKYWMRFRKGTNFYLLILSHLHKSTPHAGGSQGMPAPPQHGMHQENNKMHKSRHLFSSAGWAPQQNTSVLMLPSVTECLWFLFTWSLETEARDQEPLQSKKKGHKMCRKKKIFSVIAG